MKVLQIVESAYRATLEEQDDTVLWLSHGLKNNGIDITVLLRNNAVNYAVRPTMELPSLAELGIPHPPKFAADLEKMASKGIPICAWQHDLAERGIGPDQLIGNVRLINAADLAKLMSEQDYILHW